MYTIRGAYGMLKRQAEYMRQQSSDLWKHIWELKVPAKCVNLVWRMAT